MKNYSKIILGVAASLFAVTGCMEKELIDPSDNSVIRFGVNTEYDNGEETRTEYSGQFTGSSPKREIINWLSTDRISIVSAETTGANQNDYTITPQSDKSTAAVSPVSTDNQFYWANGTDDHYFYALYPAATQTGAPSGVSIATASGHRATVAGSIPADQSTGVTLSDRTYKPNMNYAYMYAAKKQKMSQGTNVTLEFKPLVTALEFQLLADNTFPITSNLTKVELISSSTNLAGNFTATLNENGLSGNPTVSGGTKTLTMTLPNGGIQLSKTAATTFTFLALPIQQTNLTLKLYFGSTTRSILLKSGSSNIAVPACKKVYIRSVGVVPEIDYTFEVTGPTVVFSSDAQTFPYSVKSYKEGAGTKVPVKWTAKYYDKKGNEINKPSWLTQFTNQGNGSSNPTQYNGKLTENTPSVNKSWGGPKTVSGNTDEAHAIDLSLYDIYGTAHSCTTANSYVVSKPGWYKLPCVYGNAIKNGSANSSAYNVTGIVNHYGNQITQPWIQNHEQKDAGFLRTYHSEYQVKLAWQDVESLITQVKVKQESTSYSNGNKYMIYFYVSPDNINQGNAVICLLIHHWEEATGLFKYNEGTDVAWSWHIWATEDTSVNDHLETTAVNGWPGKNVTNPNYMMNVNLGWYDAQKVSEPHEVRVVFTQNESGATGEFTIFQHSATGFGGNVYYQWGRKDPLTGFNENYQEHNAWGDWKLVLDNSGGHDVAYSILHPNHMLINQWDWASGISDKMWNANAGLGNDVAVTKTVYDPCPPGFKVPNKNAFTGFAQTDATITISGQNQNSVPLAPNAVGPWHDGLRFKRSSDDTEGLFFARTSLREWNSGIVRLGYESGHVWTASRARYGNDPNQGYTGIYLEYWGSKGSSNSNPRVLPVHVYGPLSFGFAVRPVKE